jgi:hypothetical protein
LSSPERVEGVFPYSSSRQLLGVLIATFASC